MADNDRAPNKGIRRPKLDPGQCIYCDKLRADGVGFFPPHDASENCQSGKHSHCTCEVCF